MQLKLYVESNQSFSIPSAVNCFKSVKDTDADDNNSSIHGLFVKSISVLAVCPCELLISSGHSNDAIIELCNGNIFPTIDFSNVFKILFQYTFFF